MAWLNEVLNAGGEYCRNCSTADLQWFAAFFHGAAFGSFVTGMMIALLAWLGKRKRVE